MNRRHRGVALVLVLGIAVLLLLLAAATARLTQGRGETRELGIESQRAAYLAEAGIEYVRAAVLRRAEDVVAATNPRGIRMPTMTYSDVLVHLDVEVDEEEGFRLGPIPVKGSGDKTLGHFVVHVGLVVDAMGSSDMDLHGAAAPELPAGLGWLPALSIESIGLSGPDPLHPGGRRRVVAVLRPLPPPVLGPARTPERSILLTGADGVNTQVAMESLYPSLPSYGVPSYEISDYVDMGTPDPQLWLLDQSPEAPPVYPPVSSLPHEAPEPWWFIPTEERP